MSIQFRKDRKKWLVNLSIQGKRHQILCATKKQAQEIETGLKLKKAGFEGIQRPYSLAEAFASYLETESAQKTDASRKADKKVLDHALQFFSGNISINVMNGITLEDLQRFQIFVSSELGWSDTTVFKRMSLLKAVFNKAFNTGRISKDPCQFWKVPRGTSERRRAMTSAEFEKLIQSDPFTWVSDVLRFIRLTGARGASVADLAWSDVDFSKARILLSSRKGGLKKMKTISFPMYPELFNFLSRISGRIPRHEKFVFLDLYGQPLTGHKISVYAHNAIRKAGLKGVCLYSLRHALAVDLTERGVSMEIVRQLMGHSSIRQSQDYAQGVSSDCLGDSMTLIRGTVQEAPLPDANESENTSNVVTLKIVK